jgi:hypothetical protein
MSTPTLGTALTTPIPSPLKKKRVLLVDTSSARRDLRAEVMRKLGMEVDCAADIVEARCWWRADLYNLVLICVEGERNHRDKFCADVRGATPPQQLAFLVGKPGYLADSPGSEEELLNLAGDAVLASGARPGLDEPAQNAQQRWGILEASRKISEVRSAWHARTLAMRDRPTPQRDSDTGRSRRVPARTLDDLLREEM